MTGEEMSETASRVFEQVFENLLVLGSFFLLQTVLQKNEEAEGDCESNIAQKNESWVA